MGVERSVTRWYVQRQAILNEIALLESQESQLWETAGANIDGGTGVSTDGYKIADVESTELVLQLTRARRKLRSLGPCPKPMMG
jgi:hypothetical protein